MFQPQRRKLEQLLERKWTEMSQHSKTNTSPLHRKRRRIEKNHNVSDELLKQLIKDCFHDLKAS